MKRFKIFLVMSVIFAQVLLVQTVSAQSVSLSTNAVLEGGTVTVYWSGFSGNVNLRFYKGNTFITYANANVPGSGQQPLVMTGYEVRDNYWIRVELRSDTSIYRDSNHFSVSNPNVSLSTNFVEQGDTVIVYWSGFASNVNLKFYRDNTFLTYANTNVSASGQQPLVMTHYEPGNYRVKVELRSKTSIYKYSDYFSVSVDDDPPYFQNAALASDVAWPETINFSGYAKDDNGLRKISMRVSGPAGTRTVFTHDISGTSKSLGGYYFDSSDVSYANEEGSYTLTLNIEDTAGQTATQTFYVTVSELPVIPEATARIVIDHTCRGDLTVDIGAGSPDNPAWVTRAWNRSGGGADDLDLETDISGGASYLPPDSSNRWFLKVHDGAGSDQGVIQEFTVTYQGQTYTSGDLSVPITDHNTSYAYIQDNDPGLVIIPDDFVSVRSAPGVTLYKNSDHYVQVVRLNRGASLKLLYSMGNEYPIEDVCISPVFFTHFLG